MPPLSQSTSLEYLREGFRLLPHKALRWYVVVPLLINTVVFGGLFWWSVQGIADLIQLVVDNLPDWLDWLRFLLWPLAIVMVLVVVTPELVYSSQESAPVSRCALSL